MRKWASTSAKTVLLAAGFVALGSGVALADSDAATSGNGSLLGGNQAVVNGDIPVNVTGNAIGAVAGVAGASSTGSDAKVIDHQHNEVHTSGNGSVLGGNQLVVDGDIPVNVTGNAISAVGGVAGASSTGSDSKVLHEAGHGHGYGHGHGHEDIATSGNGSLLGGNQLVADLDVPVNVAGNAVGAVGGVAGAAATDSDAVVKDVEEDIATSGNGSLAGGNQLVADADVPVNAAGNAVGAVAGVAGASTTDSDSKVVHQSAETESQASALDSVPLVDQLPEVPVSEMLPVDYDLSETADQAVADHAPESAAELPESTDVPPVDPVGEVLGAAGLGL